MLSQIHMTVLPSQVTKQNKLILIQQVHEYMQLVEIYNTIQYFLRVRRSSGIGSPLLEWIREYLMGRKQRVTLDKASSPWIEVLSWVPQGSILGPIFSLIYINDILGGLNCAGKLFCRWWKIYSKVSKQEDALGLQLDLNRLVHWSDKWLLEFIQNKCKFLHFGNNNQEH